MDKATSLPSLEPCVEKVRWFVPGSANLEILTRDPLWLLIYSQLVKQNYIVDEFTTLADNTSN
jgi:hypothetical protein